MQKRKNIEQNIEFEHYLEHMYKMLLCIYFSWYESENLYCMNIMQPTDYFVEISKQQKVPEIETGVYIPIN